MMGIDFKQPANLREEILFGALLLVLILLCIRILYQPQATHLAELKVRSQALHLEQEALVKFAATAPQPTNPHPLANNKGIKMKVLHGVIHSDTNDVATLLTRLTESGFSKGITVETLSYLPPATSQGYVTSDFSMKLKANFADIMRYLDQLEQFPALFSIENIRLTTAGEKTGDLHAEIEGRFFHLGGEL